MIRLEAFAKINWFLEITGRRHDGYHTLSTLFQTISLGDVLTFEPAPALSLSCSDASLPVDERNLVMRAALRLQALLNEKKGARLHLEKKVPMGAGLGGGSADAAAALRGLLKLWDRRLENAALQKLAVSLGADVPFFLEGGLCEGSGIGEVLKPLQPFPPTWLVIVWPGFGISTKEAYAKVQWPLSNRRELPSPFSLDPSCLYNRFESLVFPDHPELPRLKQDFLEAGASAALMSGSGSAVYGLAPTQEKAAQILATLQKKYNYGWFAHTI